MTRYRFDWKDLIYGRIEIEANCGTEAEAKLMEMSIKELLEKSQYNSDKIERTIRFADAENYIENMDEQDWITLKEHI